MAKPPIYYAKNPVTQNVKLLIAFIKGQQEQYAKTEQY